MTPFLDLQHTIVVDAMASSRSRIAFSFDDGSRRVAGPARKYENWEFVGPDGLNRMGKPNGGAPTLFAREDLQGTDI